MVKITKSAIVISFLVILLISSVGIGSYIYSNQQKEIIKVSEENNNYLELNEKLQLKQLEGLNNSEIINENNRPEINFTYLSGLANPRLRWFNDSGYEVFGFDHQGNGILTGNLSVSRGIDISGISTFDLPVSFKVDDTNYINISNWNGAGIPALHGYSSTAGGLSGVGIVDTAFIVGNVPSVLFSDGAGGTAYMGYAGGGLDIMGFADAKGYTFDNNVSIMGESVYKWLYNQSTPLVWNYTATEIYPSGGTTIKVGIGITTPSEKLYVRGTGGTKVIIENTDASSSLLKLNNTEGGYSIYTDSGKFYIYSYEKADAIMETNSSGFFAFGDSPTISTTAKFQINDYERETLLNEKYTLILNSGDTEDINGEPSIRFVARYNNTANTPNGYFGLERDSQSSSKKGGQFEWGLRDDNGTTISRMWLNSEGYLGIGDDTPDFNLDVQDLTTNAYISLKAGDDAYYIADRNSTASEVGYILRTNGTNKGFVTIDNTEPVDNLLIGLGVSALTVKGISINPLGYVGIGVKNATRNLVVNDTIPTIQLTNPTTGYTSNDGLLIQLSGANAFIENGEAGSLILRTNTLNRVTIDSAGKVGINISTPVYPLEVWGNGTGGIGIYAYSNISAQGYIDRTPWYEGDATDVLMNVKGNESGIDHKSLGVAYTETEKPLYEKQIIYENITKEVCEDISKGKDEFGEDIFETKCDTKVEQTEKEVDVLIGTKIEEGRDLSMTVSLLIKSIQEIMDKITNQEERISKLEKENEAMKKALCEINAKAELCN